MGGVAQAIEKPFRTGASQAKKEARKQQDLMVQQAQEAKRLREEQENVAKAQAKLAEDSMFEGAEEGLGIEGIDTEAVGGKRKRRRVQETESGLGI